MRSTGTEPIYILAAAVDEPGNCDATRVHLSSLLLRGQKRLHWRDEEAARRTKIATAVAGMGITAVVTVGSPMMKQERARRQCMERLFHHLENDLGVAHVWLESRTPSLNNADRKMIVAMRGRRLVSSNFRMEVARPQDEPMLWVPDIVAGAVGAARQGQGEWLESLQEMVTQIEIPLR